jgi:hypothetical protein
VVTHSVTKPAAAKLIAAINMRTPAAACTCCYAPPRSPPAPQVRPIVAARLKKVIHSHHALSSPAEGSDKRRFYVVLHLGGIRSPLDAVRASIVAEKRAKGG